MNFFGTYWGFFIQSIFFTTVFIIVKYYFDRRRLFILGSRLPGPRPWPIIGNALDYLGRDLDALKIITELNQKYEFVAHWLGHKLYIGLSKPEYAEILFKSQHCLNKDEVYDLLGPIFGNGILTAKGDEWKKARKLMESHFSYSKLQNFHRMMFEKADILLECLKKEEGKTSFSIFPYIKNCAIDIIVEFATNYNLNAQQEKIEILEKADLIQSYLTDRICHVWERPDFIYIRSKKGKAFFRMIDELKAFIDIKLKEIKRLYDSPEGNLTNEKIFYGKSLLRELMENEEWDDDNLRNQILTILIAGYETSSSAVSLILMILGIHKSIQEKLYNELSTKTETNLHRLEYLEMVIKETLRLYPIFPFIIRKAEQDVHMGKYLIPKGASVGVNIFSLHRDPKVYENPEEFNPDRFLPENIRKRHPYSFVPFASGLRNCIGGKFAMMTIGTIVSKILLNYKIECSLKQEDIKLHFQITLRTKDGLYPIRLIKR